MNQKKIIDAVFSTTGIKLTENDPALLLVLINELANENAAEEFDKRLNVAIKTLDSHFIQNVDDFIGVANEAIGKFTAATKELQAVLQKIQTNPATPPEANQANMSPLKRELYKAIKPYRAMIYSVSLFGTFLLGFFTSLFFK